MRKVTKIIVLILLITVTLSTIILINNKKEIKIQENTQKSNKMISMMFQDEKGNYIESNDTFWPKEGYRFNKNKSKCLNGSKIKYEDNNIIVQTTKSDKCYTYFDNNNFVEDLSGNGNHGKTYNIASWNESGVTTSNSSKKGYVNCGLENYNFGSNLTMVIKFRQDDLSNGSIFSNTEGNGIAIFYWLGRSISVHIYTDKIATYLISDIPKVNNQWYTIVVTYDGQKLIMYNNGQKIVEQAITGNIIQSTYPFFIGADPDPNGASNGPIMTISETLIFNRTLTEEEIVRDYANTIKPTNKDGMLFWYKFN